MPLSQLSTAGVGRSSSKRSAPPEHAIDTGKDMLAGQKAFRGYGKRDDKVNIYLHDYVYNNEFHKRAAYIIIWGGGGVTTQ